jgi:energy-coupling factor transporter ATP-binding protein EcfA2
MARGGHCLDPPKQISGHSAELLRNGKPHLCRATCLPSVSSNNTNCDTQKPATTHAVSTDARDVVFVTVDLNLAESMRGAGLHAVCRVRGIDCIKGIVDRRSAIVAYCGPRSHLQAEDAASYLEAHCHPNRIGVLDFEAAIGFVDSPAKFAEWFSGELSAERFSTVEDFEATADVRAKWRAKQSATPADAAAASDELSKLSDAELGIIGADKVSMRPVEWLWPYRFAAGEMALLAGDGGLGKSSLLLAIAGIVTRGAEWPDRSGRATLGSVVVVSAEDDRETTLVPRLTAMGADLSKIFFVTAKKTIKREGQVPVVSPMSLENRDYWRETLSRIPDCRLMVLDPLPSYLGRSINDSKNVELRSVIEPFLDEVTRPAKICLACNTHLNKSITAGTPLHRVSGSMAYGALPRNVHLVILDPENPEKRLFCQAKCNNAPAALPAIRYEMAKAEVGLKGNIETAYPVFDADPVTVNLGDAMAPASSRRERPREKTLEVARWLLRHLRKATNPVPLRDIFMAAGAENYIGEHRPDKEGRMKWSNPRILYNAVDSVPTLTSPDDGWIVDVIKDGVKTFWKAVRTTKNDVPAPLQ